jgi:hypothetical protein
MERYRRHGIETNRISSCQPGLNDMRSGMPVQDYLADLESIVADIRRDTNALLVLVGIYPQIYGQGANDPAIMPVCQATLPSRQSTTTRWAWWPRKLEGCLLTLCPRWVRELAASPDCCHLNDLGHVSLGNAISAIASCFGRG